MQHPRSRIPIYPRPVSPLCAEPAHARPSDVVYESDSSEDDIEAREAKRRKIVKLGQQYLRGDGLYIMTASLKGPLNAWKNPWIKHKKPKDPEDAVVTSKELEVPETATGNTNKDSNVDTAVPFLQHDFRSPKIPETMRGDAQFKSPRVQLLDAVPQNHKSRNERSPQAKDTTTATKVKDWLRMHDTYRNGSTDQLQSSPTPVVQKHTTPRSNPKKEDANISNTCSAKPGTPIGRSSRIINLLEGQDQLQDIVQEPRGQLAAGTKLSEKPKLIPREDADRAEFALLQSRRRSLHTALSSTNMSPFEYRRAWRCGVEKGTSRPNTPPAGQQTASTDLPQADAQMNGQSAQTRIGDLANLGTNIRVISATTQMNPPELRTTNSVSVPNLSAETSRTSATNVLPSAQVESVQVPRPSISQPSNIDRMLEVPEKGLADTHEITASTLAFAEASPKPQQAKSPLTTAISSKAPKSTVWGIPVNVETDVECSSNTLDTQQMLQAITPLVFSTVKKSSNKTISKTSPTTVTRPKAKKHSKTMSLVAEAISAGSSHGSIKSSLKVAKGCDQPSPFGKHGLDMETSMEDNSLSQDNHHKSGMSANLSSPPRSMPKSNAPYKDASKIPATGPVPPTNPFNSTKNSTSTGMQQDAQKVDGFVDREGYNLDAAIDDLGSYLGTWDAEKEATSLISGFQ